MDDNITHRALVQDSNRFFRFKTSPLVKKLVEFINIQLIRPNFEEIPTGEDAERFKISLEDSLTNCLAKSICDVYTIRYQQFLAKIKESSINRSDKRTFKDCLNLLSGSI